MDQLLDQLADALVDRFLARLSARKGELAPLVGQQADAQPRRLLTAQEAREYLGGLERHEFDAAVRRGDITCVRLTERRRRFRVEDLDRYIEARRTAGGR